MKRAALVLTRQHFGSLVFERETSRYLPFDHTATQALMALSQRPLHHVLAQTPREQHNGLIGLVEAFTPRGFFTVDHRFSGAVSPMSAAEGHLTGPLAVHLEVVGACNLACSHCFADPLPRNRELLSVVQQRRLFGDLAALGSFRLGLSGGEPLMRRELLEIVDAATDAGLHPCLTTNVCCSMPSGLARWAPGRSRGST